MHTTLKKDSEQLDALLNEIKNHGIEYLRNVDAAPLSTTYTFNENKNLPEHGQGTSDCMSLK